MLRKLCKLRKFTPATKWLFWTQSKFESTHRPFHYILCTRNALHPGWKQLEHHLIIEDDLVQPGTCPQPCSTPLHGLRQEFLAGRPRIKCNNASSSGWRARIHLSLTRVEAHDCVPGMRDDYFVRNASRRPYAKRERRGRPVGSSCLSLHPRFTVEKQRFFLRSSFLSSFLFSLFSVDRIR